MRKALLAKLTGEAPKVAKTAASPNRARELPAALPAITITPAALQSAVYRSGQDFSLVRQLAAGESLDVRFEPVGGSGVGARLCVTPPRARATCFNGREPGRPLGRTHVRLPAGAGGKVAIKVSSFRDLAYAQQFRLEVAQVPARGRDETIAALHRFGGLIFKIRATDDGFEQDVAEDFAATPNGLTWRSQFESGEVFSSTIEVAPDGQIARRLGDGSRSAVTLTPDGTGFEIQLPTERRTFVIGDRALRQINEPLRAENGLLIASSQQVIDIARITAAERTALLTSGRKRIGALKAERAALAAKNRKLAGQALAFFESLAGQSWLASANGYRSLTTYRKAVPGQSVSIESMTLGYPGGTSEVRRNDAAGAAELASSGTVYGSYKIGAGGRIAYESAAARSRLVSRTATEMSWRSETLTNGSWVDSGVSTLRLVRGEELAALNRDHQLAFQNRVAQEQMQAAQRAAEDAAYAAQAAAEDAEWEAQNRQQNSYSVLDMVNNLKQHADQMNARDAQMRATVNAVAAAEQRAARQRAEAAAREAAQRAATARAEAQRQQAQQQALAQAQAQRQSQAATQAATQAQAAAEAERRRAEAARQRQAEAARVAAAKQRPVGRSDGIVIASDGRRATAPADGGTPPKRAPNASTAPAPAPPGRTATKMCTSNAHTVLETYRGNTVAEAASQISVPRSCEGGSIISKKCSPGNWAWPGAGCSVRYQCPSRTKPCARNQQ